MTRTEAAQLLGVTEDVSLDELQRRYESLHNDYRIRLTNAPTAGLRATFEQKLQALASARDTLADLPSSDPVSAPEPRPSGTSGTTAEARGGRAAEHRRNEDGDGGLPRSTMIAAGIAIVLAGALAFVSLRGRDESSARASATAAGERGKDEPGTAGQLPAFADKLRVSNDSKHSAKILAAAFLYRDASGALQSEHSYEIGTTGHRPSWVIAAGNTIELDAAMERGRTWSGPVVFYSFVIEYPGQEPYLQSGIWAEDVDGANRAISLKLD